MSTKLQNISEGDEIIEFPETVTVCNKFTINSQQVTIYETTPTTDTDTETTNQLYLLCYQEDGTTSVVQRMFTQLDVSIYNTNQEEINSFFIQDVDVQTVLHNIVTKTIKSEVLDSDGTEFDLTLNFIRGDLCEVDITEDVTTHITNHLDKNISKEDQVYVKQAIPDTLSVEFHFVNTLDI